MHTIKFPALLIVAVFILSVVSFFSVDIAVAGSEDADTISIMNARDALQNAGTLYPIDGIDSDVLSMAAMIVNDPSVTLSMVSSANGHVNHTAGAITYDAIAETSTVTFHIMKNSLTADQFMMVAVPARDYIQLFDSIKATLSGEGITTNIDTCATAPSACSGLYFERTGYGRVTFPATLDLTDSDAIVLMQELAIKMEASVGFLKFDATTATQLKNAGATVALYGLNALGYVEAPGLLVRDDSGNVIPPADAGYPAISDSAFDPAANDGTFSFSVSHFTQFQVDTIYVSATGDDSADGSQAHPVSTVAHALDIVPNGGTVHVLGSDDATYTMPAGTVVTGDSGWDGVIHPPTVTTDYALTADSGYTATAVRAVEIGAHDYMLTFDKGIRIVFTGRAGKLVGWSRGGLFTPISTACSADEQAQADALPEGGDCKIDSGSDLIVWTKHFTSFVVYTQTQNQTSGGGGGGGGGGNGPVAGSYGVILLQQPTTTASTTGRVLGTATSTMPDSTVVATATSAKYVFTHNFGFGTRGQDVAELQKILVSLGILRSGLPMGYFGTLTKTAVKGYQSARGIIQKGYVGLLTRTELNR